MTAERNRGTAPDTLGYDPRDPEALRNPYPDYQRLREGCPVAYSTGLNAHVVSRADDVRNICKQAQLFSNEGTIDAGFGDVRILVLADDPLHRRQRSLVTVAFTPGRVAQLEPYIEALADRLIDGFIADGHCDLVARFAIMIPATVISKMLGVDVNDLDKFKRWADAGMRAAAYGGEHLEAAMVSALEFAEYITAAAAERKPEIERGQPRDDLLTGLLTAEIDGERLTNEELFFVCWQLLTAGHETTTSLISSCVWLLSEHPEQKAKLLADPNLTEQTIEEVLRFEGPAQAMPRRVKQDTDFVGTQLKAGELVTVLFGSANRDASAWEDPERFDITRPLHDSRRKQLAFGFGSHTCMGANLARLEGRVALRRLLARIPDIEVDRARAHENKRQLTHFTRGWEHLRVKWVPQQPSSAS